MSRTDPPLKIRLPADLKAKLKTEAHAAEISMNAFIVQVLENALAAKPGKKLRFVEVAAKLASKKAAEHPGDDLVAQMDQLGDKFGTLRRQVHKLQEADATKTLRIDDLEARLAKVESKNNT